MKNIKFSPLKEFRQNLADLPIIWSSGRNSFVLVEICAYRFSKDIINLTLMLENWGAAWIEEKVERNSGINGLFKRGSADSIEIWTKFLHEERRRIFPITKSQSPLIAYLIWVSERKHLKGICPLVFFLISQGYFLCPFSLAAFYIHVVTSGLYLAKLFCMGQPPGKSSFLEVLACAWVKGEVHQPLGCLILFELKFWRN